MDKSILKNIGKCAIFCIIWAIILFGVAAAITTFKGYALKDILFVEGIIFVIIGVFSLLEGNPMGLSIQGLGQNNSQYISNANLEVAKIEKNKNTKNSIRLGLNAVALVIGGVLILLISFII